MRVPMTLMLMALVPSLAAQSTWLRRNPAHLPPSGSEFAMAATPTGVIAHFGYQQETWRYDGVDWVPVPVHGARPTSECIGCFDSSRNRFVVISSASSSGMQTWEYDGAQWALRATGQIPLAGGFAIACDTIRGVTVLFGGWQGGSQHFADTWEWNGTAWLQRSSGGPYPRRYPAMAFDRQRGVVMLFGGVTQLSGETRLGDAWEWNGSYWREHWGVPGPIARGNASMVHDSRRQRIVLTGGSTGGAALYDTWEWDGAAWMQVSPQVASPGALPLAYDASRGVAVTHDFRANRTFEYAVGGTAASYSTYGQGCAGPAGTPALAASAGSLPRLGSTLNVALTNLPVGAFHIPFGALGFDNTTWHGNPLPVSLTPLGFPGCSLWVQPEFSVGLSNTNGVAAWLLPIPVDLDLLGVSLHQQAAVMVPGFNAGGLVFSNAGHGVVGGP
ncbi:MAG: hypothetical protein IPK26_07815 [Planctomycetes bacterium]|nr:hypothetical protein [Planctomycetota bacterium]